MTTTLGYMELCRLCLVKDKVNVPIFDDTNDVRQIFLKITACLPVKVSRDDSLPKKICDTCLYKIDLLYQFWNTTINAEKQLLQWLSEIGVDAKTVGGSLQMLPQSHAHPHALQEEIMLKEERIDPEAKDAAFPNLYTEYPYPTTENNFDADAGGEEKPAKRKTRGRPAGKKKAKIVLPESDEESIESDPLGNGDPDDSDSDGGKIAKEEADSDEDYDVDNPESLEPTQFVDVPSAADAEQPGPSGLNKSATITAAGTSDQGPFGDVRFNLRDPIAMEPMIEIKTEPLDEDENLLDLVKRLSKLRQPKTKKSLPRKAKIDQYQNPFTYENLVPKKGPSYKEKPITTMSKWTCLICNKNLTGKTDLIEHYAAHKDDKIKLGKDGVIPENEVYQCDCCLKEFTSEKRFEKHMETHNDSRFNCDYCQKSFKKPFDLAVHGRFHSNDNKLKCHICDYSTTYPSTLKTHLQRHDSEYKYKCEICGKGFFVQTWFEEHKNFHSGEKPFECNYCGKNFLYSRYLTAHKRSMHPECYTDAPPINECSFCQKRFAHKKSLLLHIRGHTGENTVLCDICGKRLSSNDHLKLHRRIHTGYKPYCCSSCGKGFSKKCNLTLHERVHSGEKPYVCDVCGKCFSQRSTLVIHTRYHTGVRPYICHLCNKGFVAKGVLSIHLKSCNGYFVDRK